MSIIDRLLAQAFKRPYAVIILAVLLVWGHTIRFGFVWDDYFFIETNESIRSLGNVPRMFTDLAAQSSYEKGFIVFRPLRTAHYALLYWLGGGHARPWLFHLADVVWHAFAACLMYAVARRLLQQRNSSPEFDPRPLALFAAVGFAVHPVLSETVCWAKGLDDIMAAVFALAATLLILRWKEGWGRCYWGAAVLFVAAVYSKESAVPWAAFAGLIFWRFHRRGCLESLARTIPLFVLAALALWHRHLVMGRSSQTAPISGTYSQTLIDMFPTVSPYLRLILGIQPFCIDYSYMTGGNALLSGPVLLGAFLLCATVGLTVWALLNERWLVVGLGGAWFLLFMLPVSNVVPMMQYMAERFLYLPMMGCIWIAAGVSASLPHRRRVAAIAVLICTVWAAIAWSRSWIWRDEVSLFVQTHLECPRTERVEQNAVSAILKQPHMQLVFKIRPRPGELPLLEIAPQSELKQADWPKVLGTLRQMEMLFPTNTAALGAIGIGRALSGHPEEAIPVLERATALQPSSAKLWRDLGMACVDAGQHTEAITALEKALQLAPEDTSALQTLAAAYWKKNDFSAAAKVFERLTRLEPNNPEHRRWLKEATDKAASH